MAGSATIIASLLLLVACMGYIFPTGETSGPSLGLLVAQAPKGVSTKEGEGPEQPGAGGVTNWPGT